MNDNDNDNAANEDDEIYAGRYRRHELVDWLDQKRLAKTRVVVIGAGAIGNEVIKNLVLLGVGSIDIIDFDTIELHNLTRSVLFRESDVGLAKSDVAAARALEMDPGLTVQSIVGDFWSEFRIKDITAYDLVFACVDSYEARMHASLLCRLAGVDFVSAGIDSRYVSLQRHPFSRLSVTRDAIACYECDMTAGAYAAVSRRYSCGWLRKIADEQKLMPTTAVTASVAGALAVSSGLRSDAHNTSSTRVVLDTLSGHSTPTSLLQNPDCFACGGLDRVTSLHDTDGTYASLAKTLKRDLELSGFDPHLVLSEPVIVSCRCANDSEHAQALDAATRLKPARAYSEAIAWCSLCGESSIDVEIIETLTLSEWRERFPDAVPGCAFIIVKGQSSTTQVYEIH